MVDLIQLSISIIACIGVAVIILAAKIEFAKEEIL